MAYILPPHHHNTQNNPQHIQLRNRSHCIIRMAVRRLFSNVWNTKLIATYLTNSDVTLNIKRNGENWIVINRKTGYRLKTMNADMSCYWVMVNKVFVQLAWEFLHLIFHINARLRLPIKTTTLHICISVQLLLHVYRSIYHVSSETF